MDANPRPGCRWDERRLFRSLGEQRSLSLRPRSNPFWSIAIPHQIFVVRHGHVADHRGDVALTPDGRRVAFDAGVRLSESIGDGQTASILYAPSARTRETAEELALGLALGLRSHATSGVRIAFPRAEPAIRNFHFLVDGRQLPPTDALHPSFPAAAEQDPYLTAFWGAEGDRIGYWMSHPSERVESPAAVAARLTFSSSHYSTPLSRMFPCS